LLEQRDDETSPIVEIVYHHDANQNDIPDTWQLDASILMDGVQPPQFYLFRYTSSVNLSILTVAL